MSPPTLLVTGASGHLGRLVLDALLDRGDARLVATTRNPASLAEYAARGVEVRRADFEDEAALDAAFEGVERALLISTDAIDVPLRRIAQHRRAVAALARAGARHVVYTSLPSADRSHVTFAPDHSGTEDAIRETSLDFTILRNNVYTDLLLFSLPGAIASGKLVHGRGQGAVAYVTRADCARTAAAALARGDAGRQVLDVTGPEALTAADLAALASELSGKPVESVSVPVEALVAGMVQHGMPPGIAAAYASFDTSAGAGELERVTDTVERLTGRPPRSVREFLLENRAALAPAHA